MTALTFKFVSLTDKICINKWENRNNNERNGVRGHQPPTSMQNIDKLVKEEMWGQIEGAKWRKKGDSWKNVEFLLKQIMAGITKVITKVERHNIVGIKQQMGWMEWITKATRQGTDIYKLKEKS